jgi:gamma-glutamylcyclotransferase (GGCT)/AIG2-like uncharacterized protein YtfP
MSSDRRATRLFLYGTLLTGTADRNLNRRIRRLLRLARPATIQARLYAIKDYPGAIASGNKADRVYGKVIEIDDPRLLRDLDKYEDYRTENPGCGEFIRCAIQARRLGSGRNVTCWVYLYNRTVTGRTYIVGGDYLRYVKSRRRG